MTLAELKKQFPIGAEVRLTQAAQSRGMARVFRGHSGKVEGHGQKFDLAGNPVFTLLIWLDGYRRRKDCAHSVWERVGGDLPR